MVEVTKEDREAAASVAVLAEMRELILSGRADHHAEPWAIHRQRGKLEGARLALEVAIREADEHARLAWKIGEREGQSSICSSGRNYGARAVGQSIRALSPAKIVGEG